MKKVQKALALALGLALGAGVLVACGGNTDDGKNPAGGGGDTNAVPYWLAGKIRGENVWGDDAGAVPNEYQRFTNGSTANVYEIKIDLWEEDMFKIRYENKSWSGFQANYTNAMKEEHKSESNPAITFEEGGNDKEYNFYVAQDGNYVITLDVSGEEPVVSYERKGDLEEAKPIFVEKVTLNNYAIALEVKGTKKLEATISPDNADNKDVMWVSDDDSIATVSEDGVVTAVKAGETDITAIVSGAKDGDIEVACHVIVVAEGALVNVETVSLNKTAATLQVGKGDKLTATIAPANATLQAVAFVSEDESIVEVNSETGELLAHKPGKVKIIASADGKTTECEVTVEKTYYLRGNLIAADWPEITSVDEEGVIYFTETETAGIYKTDSVKILKGQEFQVAVVADGWAGAVKNSALPTEEGAETLKYFAKNGDSNIKCNDTAEYTITLDLTDEKNPSFTVVQDKDLPDDAAAITGFGIYGDASSVGWDGPAAENKVNLTKGSDGKWTGTATVEIVGAGQFQFRCEVDGTTIYIDNRWTNATFTPPAGITAPMDGESNFAATAEAAGTYTVTITLDALGDVLSIVMTKA